MTKIKYPAAAPIGEHERIEATQEFCDRNKFSLQRTPAEYAAIMDEHTGGFLDFTHEVIVSFMPFSPETKRFFNDDHVKAVESGEKEHTVITDIVEAAQELLDYMVFAWDKATSERGISAGRSIQKLSAWLWVLGRTDLSVKIESNRLYNPYGAPALIAICEDLGINVPEYLREFAKQRV